MSLGTELDLKTLANAALELANTAVHFDNSKHNLVGAVEYYDKCILHLDEILPKLPKTSPLFHNFSSLRAKYDERMETLRDLEKSRYEMNIVPSFGGGKHQQQQQHANTNRRQQKLRRQSMLMFEEDSKLSSFVESVLDSSNNHNNNTSRMMEGIRPFEEPPVDKELVAFWQMNIIQRTITTGDFLTPSVYVPKCVWGQVGVKFSGLSAKTNAYKQVLQLMQNLVTTPFDDTEHALTNCLMSLRAVNEDCVNLQNSLAKSFHFIKEIEKKEEDKESLQSKGQVARLANMVGSFGKSVKKYAEVGMSRLSAMSAHVSDEDFQQFAQLTVSLCNECQVLRDWIVKVKTFRVQEEVDAAALKQALHANRRRISLNGPAEVVDNNEAAASEIIRRTTTEDDEDVISSKLTLLKDLSLELHSVAEFLKCVICEIMLHDVESLLDRYLKKTRKGFTRMQWDDDSGMSSETTRDSMLE